MRGSDTDKGRVPISKYLVSRELSFDERIGYIRKLLASKQEQEEAKNLKPNEASKFIELLDEVRSFVLSPPPPMSYDE